MHWLARVGSSLLPVCAALILPASVCAADETKTNPYVTLQLQKGQVYATVFSKALEVRGEGFDDYTGRYSGTAAYKVLDPNPDRPEFDLKSPAFDKATYHVMLTLLEHGRQNCIEGKCEVDRETSGLTFNPLLWGMPAGELKVGQTWQLVVTEPWEIGPQGIETVSIVSLDPATGAATLRREGNGSGASQDDARKLSIVIKGRKLEATVTAGASHWSGLTTIQHGMILNDEILIRRSVTLQTEAGQFSAEETEYTLLNQMPTTGIEWPDVTASPAKG
ncbi:MAG TPA: hypothetical protein VH327_00105 [Gammaproteobacteria bacterium]|nr:hypothetical protein [Gammaproteobacteria bacterium]